MYLPPESPEAFGAVSTVTLFMDEKIWHTMPLAFLGSLPSARNCTIVGGAIFDTPSFPENSYYSALRPLQTLRVSLRGGFPQHVLYSSALVSVPCVETTDMSENTVGVLLSHLDSELSVVIRFDHCEHEDDRDFEAIYTSRTTGRVRKLGAGLAWYQRYYTRCEIACLGLDFPALRHRITTLTIHARLCVLIPHHILALPACSEITLELATAEDLVQLVTSTVSFVLPVLDRAVLRSTAATIQCDPFALLRLVTTTLVRRRDSAVGRLQMQLHGVAADDIASDLTLLVDISRTSV
ncbi:hypothetical protein EXIGLDRAFT_751403 [Exidia glandulosa HHB12029]|uniref:F-box domain-containing protein n=1 Tax=Exidia glandulosa HHB12029 TaxID=1314781 RepID=A0A165FGU0_EXIGL|nr:hypothetical protein EXIGLDRAFT_751403 [Exidia glandulosa HHB12029]